VGLDADCDGDTVLARVVPAGPACHTGAVSCFGDVATGEALAPASAIAEVARRIAERQRAPVANPSATEGGRPSYTQRLLGDRNLRLKKLGEEATELAIACADGDRERAAEEVADLLYHALVALAAAGGSLADVERVLAGRAEAAG
jgi:phosphoribosyl-AMP cyclohydrolase / phosphoribosyl-ATP pyrophosphohydrolase